MRLLLDVPAGLRVMADALALQQVFSNLLSNAIKYNRPGGQVRLSAEPTADGRLSVQVHDDGPGLSPAQIAGLYQPFNRLGAEHGGTPGSGLGLLICQQLVQGLGGRLAARSQPGEGSCFSFDLALADAPVAARPEPEPAAPAEGQAPRRVLYVEDNEVNVLLMSALIGLRPHLQLVVARDAAAALQAALAQPPDILLLDYHLPDGDGLTLLAELRCLPGLATAPAVLVTAASDGAMAPRALAAGFCDLWTKPLNVMAMLSAMAAVERRLGSP